MRLFTGVEIPPEILDNLERAMAALRPAARIKWSRAANMHITTRFIGEWPDGRLIELVEALAAVPPSGEIPVAIRGLGWFPNERSPRVFWAGIEAGSRLAELARATEEATARLGVEPERREYSPHLTLARIKTPVELTPLKRAIDGLPTEEFGAFTARRFHLYESLLHPAGSIYRKRAEFSLQP